MKYNMVYMLKIVAFEYSLRGDVDPQEFDELRFMSVPEDILTDIPYGTIVHVTMGIYYLGCTDGIFTEGDTRITTNPPLDTHILENFILKLFQITELADLNNDESPKTVLNQYPETKERGKFDIFVRIMDYVE